MRVIARSTLIGFVQHRVERRLQTGVKGHLDAWFAEVARAEWRNSAELKSQYDSASIVSAERVVFNVKGNDYRLVVAISYHYQVVLIQWLGTHKEYDKIEVTEVEYDADGTQIRPVRTAQDHLAAITRIEQIMSAAAGTPEGEELDVLATLVDAYERKHFAIDAPDPVTAIQFRMEQQQMSRKDLEPMIGSRARVSEVLSGRRALTLGMVRRLRNGLGISADLLIGPSLPARKLVR